jgi:hypothetical protein
MLKAFLLIVVGLAGDPEHGKTFHTWGTNLAQASEKLGIASENMAFLVDAPAEGDQKVTGRATKDEVAKVLQGFGARASADDVVFVVLIGHGSFDGRAAKFNMPGPDMTAADFNALFAKLPTKQVVFVNTASASGPMVEGLSGASRTIVTATRSGAEQYATLFGGFFIDALVSEAADSDKNKRVSVLEAFQFAKAEVTKAYEREGLLATEHALLDDNGDKDGSPDPSASAKDGRVANIVSLGAVSSEGLPSDPKIRALYVERRELERRVEGLRLLKDSMEPGRYASELEKMVTAIALKTREIRVAEGR